MNIARAVTAGLLGGLIVDAFLIIIRAAPFPGIYQFIASTVAGPVAFSSTAYVPLGVLMHFAISIAFALGYAFVASRSPLVAARPLVWGAIFGAVVFAIMQVVLAVAHAATPPTIMSVVMGLISHIVFFGWPIAFYIGRAGKQHRPLAA